MLTINVSELDNYNNSSTGDGNCGPGVQEREVWCMEAHDKHVPDSKWGTKFSVAFGIIMSQCCVSNIRWLCYSCHPLQKPVTSRECWQVCPVDCHVSPWSEWSSCPQQCVPGKCKGSALLSSVYGTASKDLRTGCKKTVNLLLKIDALQFDDCLYVYIHCSV